MIHYAACYGKLNLIRELVAAGKNINVSFLPLHYFMTFYCFSTNSSELTVIFRYKTKQALRPCTGLCGEAT